METSSNKLVTIMNAHFLHEIQIAQSKLEVEGIQSFIIDDKSHQLLGTGYVDGFRLQVNTLDILKAKEILDSISK